MARNDYFICPVCDGKTIYDSSGYRGGYTGIDDGCLAKLVTSLAAGDPSVAVEALNAVRREHIEECESCEVSPCPEALALDAAVAALGSND